MKLSVNSSPLLRQILVYTLAAILPVSLFFVSAGYSRTALEQEVLSANAASVKVVHTSLDSQFCDLRDLLSIAGNNPNLSLYKLITDPVSAENTIADIISTHALLNDLILYIRNNEWFYSGEGSFDSGTLPSQYFVKDFAAAGGSVETWLDLMQNVTDTSYWANLGKNQSTYLYMFTPVYYLLQSDGSIAKRTACVVLQQDYIKEVFLSSQTIAEEGMLLLSPTGAPLSKLTNRTTESYVSQVCDYIRNHPEIYETGYAQLPGSGLLVFASRSADTGLVYVRFLPQNIAYSSLQTQSTLAVAFGLLIAIFGFILIFTNTRRHFRPLLTLVNWIHGSSPEEPLSGAAPQQTVSEMSPPAEENPPRPELSSILLADLLSSSCLDYDLMQLENALTSRNADLALAILQRLRAAAKLSQDPELTERLFSRISSAVQKHSQTPVETPELAGSTPDSVFDTLTAQILAALATPVKAEPLVQTDIGAQLLEYIDTHCLSYDFQLKNMAEHFAISPQYMRKLFKAHVGISLSEYVSNKRLERATYLLSETDMTLQDIVPEIGNSDISGFVRFFKQKTGMTPGQFRKAQKEKDTAQ